MRALVDRLRLVLGLPPARRGPDAVAPPPRVRVLLPGAVPGLLVRLLPGALVLLATALCDPQEWTWWVGAALALGATVRPDRPFVPVALVVVGLRVYTGPDLAALGVVEGGGLARLSALVVAVHLALRAAGLAQHVAWVSLVELAVLWRALRSVLVVQAVVQVLVLGSVWSRANLGAWLGGSDVVRLVAVLATVGAVALVVPRGWLRPRRRPTETAVYDPE